MTAEKCRNCAPGCPASLNDGKLLYHVLKAEQFHGFDGTAASMTKMGSICPACGCKAPARAASAGF